MFIDVHAHLNDPRLAPQADAIVSAMAQDNLLAIINTGYDRYSSELGVELASKYPNVYTTLGIHPHDAKDAEASDYGYFQANASNPKVVAIGEIGLDFYYDHSARAVQAKVFAEQLELADSLGLPVVFHLRDAFAEFERIVTENKHYLNNGGLLHCYSGSKEMAQVFSKRFDFYFSFGGAITFKNAKKDEIVKAVPKERLLLETDCPYMTPEPYRGRLNYPKYVALVAQKMANMLNLPAQEVARITTTNAKTLFKRLI